jgi:hypothetical protein
VAEKGLFMITDTSAMHALAKYAARESLRGKGLMDTARKVSRFLRPGKNPEWRPAKDPCAADADHHVFIAGLAPQLQSFTVHPNEAK